MNQQPVVSICISSRFMKQDETNLTFEQLLRDKPLSKYLICKSRRVIMRQNNFCKTYQNERQFLYPNKINAHR